MYPPGTAELQDALAGELDIDADFTGDPGLLAALFIAGYQSVMVATARRLILGETPEAVIADHRERLDVFFDAMDHGVEHRR